MRSVDALRRFRRLMIMDERCWWKVIRYATIALLLAVAFGDGLGRLEGKFFPVKTNLVMSNVREQPSTEGTPTTLFDGQADKLRDCTLVKIHWYFRDGDESTRVEMVRRDRPSFSDRGKFYFRNWRVFLSKDDLTRRSYAVAWHDCHPLFNTLSVLYDSATTGEKTQWSD